MIYIYIPCRSLQYLERINHSIKTGAFARNEEVGSVEFMCILQCRLVQSVI